MDSSLNGPDVPLGSDSFRVSTLLLLLWHPTNLLALQMNSKYNMTRYQTLFIIMAMFKSSKGLSIIQAIISVLQILLFVIDTVIKYAPLIILKNQVP